MSQVVFVARKQSGKTLARGAWRKVKRFVPTTFIEIGHEIVVLVRVTLVLNPPAFQAVGLVTAVSAFIAADSGCNRVAIERVL